MSKYSARSGQWWWTLIAAAILGVAGVATAALIGVDVGGFSATQSVQATGPILFLGTFFVSCIVWWLLVGWPRRLSLRRGAICGVLVGLLFFPAGLAIAELLRPPVEAVGTPGERGFGVLELAVLTLVTTGFVSTIIMGAIGILVALALRPAYPPIPARKPGATAGRWLKAGAVISVAAVLALIGGFAWLSLLPLDSAALTGSRTMDGRAASYEEAMARFAAIRAEEAKLPLHPRCGSMLLSHGAKVARTVVYFHGLTNCPGQAEELAPQLFALGYNVYVPRWPGHGELDQMTLSLIDLTAEQMAASAGDAIDLAHGLGDEVIVTGMSAGGTMTAWAAQYRADVTQAVAVSPFLGPHLVPPWANRAAVNLLQLMPNMMILWNPLEPNGSPAMDHAYPQIPSHGLAQFMRLGEVIASSARESPPLAAGLGMLLNDADFAVNNALARDLVAAWQRHGKPVDLRLVPRTDRLPHDVIDPRLPGARTDLVYPVLIDMIQHQPAAAP